MEIAATAGRFVWRRLGWDAVGFAVSLGLMVAACFALFHLLQDIRIEKVGAALKATPIWAIAVAGLLIATSYFTLTFYDFFALRTIGRTHITYRHAAVTGVLSYTIGHNLGATVFTAGLVRFRMYSPHGLSLIDVGKIAFITGLTFWLGNAVALGIGLSYAPEAASALNQLPPPVNRLLAVAALIAIAGYLCWLIPRPRVIGRNGWKVTLPNARSTLVQIGIGIADLGTAALAMFALVSSHVPVETASVLVAYVLAAMLGFASHAPGGLGVFDAAMLLALPQVETEQLLASLLIFRALYYLLPFALAIVALGVRELWLALPRR